MFNTWATYIFHQRKEMLSNRQRKMSKTWCSLLITSEFEAYERFKTDLSGELSACHSVRLDLSGH